ncbi:hypothetical protein GGS23DRAFT_589184 [Durotheca rogersii]|uniref:uncharacterized protein n=1 Tax=Durotheca rogersii TaxID=419775 RepID=UPI0022201584|nr:uncharacterized protein GGS23DRAFT_589184 [Durotheca rogersii]KAI5856203.1 hypothetical protein GGS23DRAFT_589184 [Durotheca rogersii]
MDRVPPELLLHVFQFLDTRAPSQERLHEQPNNDMLDIPSIVIRTLKTVSLVRKSWRILVLPILFRHILWRPKISSLSAFTLNPIPLLRFLEDHQLDRAVATFTMVVDFVDKEANARRMTPEIRSVDLEWLWDQLFGVIDPLRFTIIAPPTTLAAFMSRMLFLDDAWSFSIPYHILSLARAIRGDCHEGPLDGLGEASPPNPQIPPPDTTRASQSTALAAASSTSLATRLRRPPACHLFTIRPWTSILLNEGSSTRVYRTYEFFHRRPPSMLGALLGCEEYPNDVPLIPPTIVDFNYIAIFPLSSHVDVLLQHLPRLRRLFIQLTPRPGNQILQDGDEMRHIDLADMWMERDNVYNALVEEILFAGAAPALAILPHGSRNWATLRVFECGDVADRSAWDQATEIIEESGVKGWKVGREGVLVNVGDKGDFPIVDREIDGHASPRNLPG